MANTASKLLMYSAYTADAELMTDLSRVSVQQEVVKDEKPVIEKKEETNEKPQAENQSALFNIYKSSGMRI